MAAPTEIRTTFTIDLKPFAMGLKTMLGMTQAAGKQIVPLLNLQMKAPDVGVFDQQLKALESTVDGYISQQAEAAKATETSSAATDEFEKKTRKSGDSVAQKGMKLNKMKRQALETFGAVSFLGTSIVQLASQAGGGSKELDKLSRGMNQGISAGFGLASMMKILIPTMGGLGIGIGVAVAVGTALLTFLDNAEDKAKRAEKAMGDFTRSLRGASIGTLKEQAELFKEQIKGQDEIIRGLKDKISGLEKKRVQMAREAGVKIFEIRLQELEDAKSMLAEHEKERAEVVKKEEDLNKQIESLQKTHAETRKETEKDLIAAIENRFNMQRQIAQSEFRSKEEEIKNSAASEEAKNEAIIAARAALRTKFAEIDKQQREEQERQTKEEDQNRKQEEEKKKQHAKILADLETQTALVFLDIQEARELAAEKEEIKRLAIQEEYATKRIDLESKVKAHFAETEEEKTAILEKAKADREKLWTVTELKATEIKSEKGPEGSAKAQQTRLSELQKQFNEASVDADRDRIREQIKLEQDKYDRMTMSATEYLEKQRRVHEEGKQKWIEEHQVAMSAIDGVTTGFSEMFGQMLIRQRQAKDEWDAAWLAMRNSVLQTISQILAEQIKAAIIDAAMKQQSETEKTAAATSGTTTRIALNTAEQTSNITTAGTEAALGTTKAASGAAALPFPFNLIAIAAAIAAATALFKGIFRAFGFDRGGKIEQGQMGFFEGRRTEIVAPEKDFYHIARTEMIPRLMAITRQSEMRPFSMPAGDNVLQRLEETLARLEERLSKLEITGRFNGREIELALDENRRSRKRAGQSE